MTGLKLSQLCKTCGDYGFAARVEGEDLTVKAVNALEGAGAGEVSFLSNPKYAEAVARTKASAVILRDGIDLPSGVSAIRCADPYAAVTVAIIALHGYRRHPQWGLSPRAVIDPEATIGDNPNIAAGATIAAGVTIGSDCTIYPGCYIAPGARIGDDCVLFPNVVVYDHCVLGDRVTVHAGSVIGQDGLGYAPHGEKWIKIPQVGRAFIGNDVEIGANCAIDRATLGQTEIGDGTKFGNAVVIGHGAKIGPDCMLVGLVGIAGSATVGRHVTLAGQVGVGGHLKVGDNVTAGGGTAIVQDVEPGATVLGYPALPAGEWRRLAVAQHSASKWMQRVKDLERNVRELRSKLESQTGDTG